MKCFLPARLYVFEQSLVHTGEMLAAILQQRVQTVLVAEHDAVLRKRVQTVLVAERERVQTVLVPDFSTERDESMEQAE